MTTILTLVIGINFSGLLVPFLSLTGAALWHCRRHPITVVCRPRCAACAALRSDAVIHRRERPLRDLSRRARHSPGDLYGHDGAVRLAGGPSSGYSQPVSGSATPLKSTGDWLIEVMKITPTPHFVSFFPVRALPRRQPRHRLAAVGRPRRHYDGIFWHLTDAIQDHNCQFPEGPVKANRSGNPLCGLRVGWLTDRRGLDPRLILVAQRAVASAGARPRGGKARGALRRARH